MTQQLQTPNQIPVSDLRLDGYPFGHPPVRVTITQSEGSHDEVVIRALGTPNDYYKSGQNSLISFYWGDNRRGRFYGYVTDVTSERDAEDGTKMAQITAHGPTFVMKTGRPRFYTEVTVADVVQRMAAEHSLGFSDEYGKKHYVWRQLAQTDESDWEFATDLCLRVGADLICSSGVLRLIDPMNVLTRTSPIMFYTASLFDNNPTLFDLAPAHYSARLPSQYSPTVSYLSNGVVMTVDQGQGQRSQIPAGFSSERPILNGAEAALAQIRMPVNWEEQASARVEGDPRIEPGVLLQLKVSAQTVRSMPYDGLWYVISVTHSLTSAQGFQSKLDLARVTKAPRMPGISPKQWHLDPRGRPQLVATPKGTWASTWR